MLDHIINLLNIFTDVLIILVMVLLGQESLYLKLVLELYVKIFCLFSKFHSDIDAFARLKSCVKLVIVISIDSFDEIVLVTINLLLNFHRSANWSLRSFTVPVFVNEISH